MIRTPVNVKKLRNFCSGVNPDEKGFTVAEFLVAFAMLSLLMAGMIKLFTMLNQSNTTQNVTAGVQQVVRTGIDIMTKNIRMAGFNPMMLPDVGFKADISKTSIHFSYDLDADGVIASEEDITYLHEGQKLKRDTRDGGPVTFIDNVTDLQFIYLDVKDQITTKPGNIKTVVISMTVTEPAGREKSVSRTYSTRVICRNLGL